MAGWNFFKDVLNAPDPGAGDPSDPSSAGYRPPSSGPDYAHGSQGGAMGHWNPDGSWTWDTGSYSGTTIPASQAQANADLYGQSVSDPTAAKQAQDNFAKNSTVVGTTDLSGATGSSIGNANAVPGGTLDTGTSDSDRSELQTLIAQLQQQAATGDGSWQKALATSTQNAQNTASALGQSEGMQSKSGGYADSLRNIGNAQSAAAQGAVGEGNILRAQTEQNAQDQLSNIFGQQGSQDVNQSAAAAAARQQVREANQSLAESGQKATLGYIQSGAQALATLSHGGKVPGRSAVFGDDSRNDTVPAKLSPQEIVIPRSIALRPDAPMASAAFVAAIKAGRGPKAAGTVEHFDSGGQAWQPGDPDPSNTGWNVFGLSTQAPSIENGGVLNTADYDTSRGLAMDNAGLIEARARGAGPSVVPQELTNTQDSAIAAGLRGRGPASAMTSGATEEAMHGGAGAVRTAMGEQQGASRTLGEMLLAQRQNDIALAEQKQQAAFRNTLMNAGVTLQNQAAVKSIVGGVGTALTAFSGLHNAGVDSGGGGTDGGDPMKSGDLGDQGTADLSGGGDEVGDPSSGQTNDLGDQGSFAQGGAVGYDEGGRVVRSGHVNAEQTLNAMKAEYEANQAKQAIDKGPDLAYRISQAGKFARDMATKATGSAKGMAGGGAAGDPRWLNVPDSTAAPAPVSSADDERAAYLASIWMGERPQSASPPVLTGALPQDRYPPPAGGSSTAPQLPSEQELARLLANPPTADQAPVVKAAPRPPPESSKAAGHIAQKSAPTLAQGFERAGLNPETPPETPLSPEERIGDIKAEEATRLAGLARENEERAAAYQRDLRATADRSAARADELLSAHRAAIEEMSKPLNIDTGRFWASRTTGQKISGIIGMALGAFGTGPDGINKAAQMMQSNIERDIDAQKSEHTIRLQQGKAKAEGYQSLYQQAHEMTGDEVTAKKLAFAAGMDIAASKAERVAQETANPMAKQQAQLLARDWRQKADSARAETRLKLAEADFHEAQVGKLERGGAGGGKPLPAEQVASLGDLGTAQKAVDQLLVKHRALGQSGIGARISAAASKPLGLNTDSAKFNDDARATAQTVGYILEGGKLSDADVPRYLEMLPKPGDSDERAALKRDNVNRLLQQKLEGRRGAFQSSGFKVPTVFGSTPFVNLED